MSEIITINTTKRLSDIEKVTAPKRLESILANYDGYERYLLARSSENKNLLGILISGENSSDTELDLIIRSTALANKALSATQINEYASMLVNARQYKTYQAGIDNKLCITSLICNPSLTKEAVNLMISKNFSWLDQLLLRNRRDLVPVISEAIAKRATGPYVAPSMTADVTVTGNVNKEILSYLKSCMTKQLTVSTYLDIIGELSCKVQTWNTTASFHNYLTSLFITSPAPDSIKALLAVTIGESGLASALFKNDKNAFIRDLASLSRSYIRKPICTTIRTVIEAAVRTSNAEMFTAILDLASYCKDSKYYKTYVMTIFDYLSKDTTPNANRWKTSLVYRNAYMTFFNRHSAIISEAMHHYDYLRYVLTNCNAITKQLLFTSLHTYTDSRNVLGILKELLPALTDDYLQAALMQNTIVSSTRYALARMGTTLSLKLRFILMRDSSDKVRVQVAKLSDTEEILKQLACDASVDVRKAVLSRTQNSGIITALLSDAVPEIRKIATARLNNLLVENKLDAPLK